MRARWFPLYILAILALTLFPFRAPICDYSAWRLDLLPSDGLANLLLFMPLGVGLRRSSILRAIALAFALSLAIEVAQEWLPRRQDVTDLVANTAGAAIGHWLGRAWTRRWGGPLVRPVTLTIALRVGTVVLFLAAILGALVNPAGDFSDWERFPLVLGNEATGDRPWSGHLAELSIYDRALLPDSPTNVPSDEDTPPEWKDGGPILWLRFSAPSAGRLDGPNGPVPYLPGELRLPGPMTPQVSPTLGVALAPGRMGLEPFVGQHLLERLGQGRQLTVDARIQPANLQQQRLASIVSFGGGSSARNFLLAQIHNDIIFRIRMPRTDPSRDDPQSQTRGGVLTGEMQHVRAVYDGYTSLILIDGKCVKESSHAMATASPLLSTPLGLTIVFCTAFAGLAAASFAPDSRRRRVLFGALASTVAWSTLWACGAWHHVPNFDGIAAVLGIAAFLASIPLLRSDG